MDSYEKKYKEALKKAEGIIKYYKERNRDEASIEDLGTIFPELKESEDEKIRKALVRFHGSTIDIDGIKGSDIVAWLEKQSKQKSNPYSGVSFEYNRHTWGICARDGGVEILTDGNLKAFVSLDKSFVYPVNPIPDIKPKSAQEAINEEKVDNQNCVKHADKVEPKFHEGEWITNGEYTWKIVEVKPLDYILQSQDCNIVDDTISHVDEQFHSFTIQDAKDGDVLAAEDKDKIFIYNGKLDLRGRVCAYCGIYKTHDGLRFTKCAIGNYFTYKEPYPATKEQRDTLFGKMHEASYEWDAEKKELKHIDARENLTLDGDLMQADCMIVEQEPAWSEEDEERIKNILSVLDVQVCWDGATGKKGNPYQKEIDFLKSLKERIKG